MSRYSDFSTSQGSVPLPAVPPPMHWHTTVSGNKCSSRRQACFSLPCALGEVKVPRVLIALTLFVVMQTDKEHHFSSFCFSNPGPSHLYSMSQRNQRKRAQGGSPLSSSDLCLLLNLMTPPETGVLFPHASFPDIPKASPCCLPCTFRMSPFLWVSLPWP